ncbi:MAG TPA: hypothetical protein ENI54_04675 [bacterium]|nr:hypothetical protein [bacterium]
MKVISLLAFTIILTTYCFLRPPVKSFAKSQSQMVYPYVLSGDPFQTFLYTRKSITSFKIGELPLLQYSLSSLKIVGIIERKGKYFAMVKTPGNRSYIITVGSIVGVDRARVTSINGNEVKLVERTYNAIGQMRSEGVVMNIK